MGRAGVGANNCQQFSVTRPGYLSSLLDICKDIGAPHYSVDFTHRYFGRRMLLFLSSHPDFDKILEKYIPTKDLPTVRDTVSTLKSKVTLCEPLCMRIFFFAGSLLLSSYLEIVAYFRVLVRCSKTPSQRGADALSLAVVQSEPHRSPGSLSARPTGVYEHQTLHPTS